MSYAVAIAMFGWIPLVLALFAWLPPRRAAIVGFLLAWMFLPFAAYTIPGLPDYTKMSATCGGVLLGILIFDFRRLVSLRFRWADLPVLLFCLSAFASAISNGLGVHEGLSAALARMITWGAPYLIGRLYFADLPGLRELAFGILCGGLLYVPLCLIELAAGPQLHRWVYGYYQPFLDQELRFGILRPMVFMDSGLMVAVWMAATTVLALWLWKGRALPARYHLWLTWFAPVMAVTTVSLRSANGWVLLALGVGLLVIHSFWHSAVPFITLTLLIFTYVGVRATGVWSGEQSIPAVEALINAAKGRSISYRLQNEKIVIGNVHERPVFGWGRQWGVVDDHKGGRAVRDSLWIVVFGETGAVGLVGLMATLLLPVMVFSRAIPAQSWLKADIVPAAGLAVILVLYTLDCLANGMINPVFMLVGGGLSGLERKP